MASEISILKTTKWATSVEKVFARKELFTLILLFLPVKLLMRLKLVSRHWKSVITGSLFSQMRNPDPNPAVGLFFRVPHSSEIEYIHLNTKSPINPPLTELYFPDDPDQYWIQHSCKGLLICCSNGPLYHKGYRYPVQKFYIYNPTTKQFVKVPIRQEKNWVVHGVALSVYHKQSPHYDVFAVGASSGNRLFRVEKYSPESGEWSSCGAPFRSDVLFNYPAYWNNTIHWIDFSNGDLTCFNVIEEKIRDIPGPVCPGIVRYFSESCDHLLLIKNSADEATFDIYEMRTDHLEWFVKYRVDISNVARTLRISDYVNQDGNVTYSISVFAVVMGKDVEDSFVVLRMNTKVVRYNFLRETFEEIFHNNKPLGFVSSRCLRILTYGPYDPLPWAVEYIESLVAVKVQLSGESDCFYRMESEISIPKRTKCSPSVEDVFALDELLTLILVSLPVKKLMRLKLVSSSWKKLITSFDFSQMRNPNPNPAVGLFIRLPHSSETEYIHLNIKSPIIPPLTEFYFPDDPGQYWIQHSCKGLLVCCTHGRFYYKGNKYPVQKCYIYNPTTKQSVKVPIRQEKDWFVHGVALSFDHKKSPPYSVYALGAEFGTRLFRMEKYSRESGEWSFCGPSFRSEVLFNYPAYWNDSINWIDYSNGDLSYFNVLQETISHIAGPVCPGIVRFFGESCDHLILIKSCQNEAVFDIYEMRRDHSQWFVKYRVDISNVARTLGILLYVNQDGNITYHFSIFAVVMGKNVEDSFVVLRTNRKVIMYKFLRETFEEITLDKRPPFIHYGPSEPLPWAVEYIESLVAF